MSDPHPVFARVLVGTDGSARAEEAVRQGARLAMAGGGSLVVAFVVDTGRAHDEEVEREAEDVLGRASAIADELGTVAETRILAGSPAEVLVAEAETHEADLVSLGPDAGLLGGAIRFGHVAAHVLREAGCSILLARSAGPSFPRRIVCGIDGSEGSVDTASLAAKVALSTGAELRLLHVVPVFRGDNAEWTLNDEDPTPEEIAPSVLAVAELGVPAARDMAMGRPEHALVAAAGRDGTDLLVVGHRGVKGVARRILGSVSEYSALHAPCSVLVVKAERG